jgi:hypothetical protein
MDEKYNVLNRDATVADLVKVAANELTVECESPPDHELSDFKQNMNQLLSNFKNSLTPSRSERLFQLAEKVAFEMDEGKEDDIDAW